MREISLRKFHRYLGVIVAPLVLLQAISGLALSIDILGRWQGWVTEFLGEVDLPALAEFWHDLSHEIHFGSGTAGLFHTLVVGVGLTVLAVSGVLIFVRVLARTVFKQTPPKVVVSQGMSAAGAGPTDGLQRRRVGVVLAFAAVGILALDVYVFAVAYRMNGLHVPHVYAAATVELYTARGRSTLEQYVSGDLPGGMEAVRAELARAELATEAMLGSAGNGVGTELFGRRVLPVADVSLRRRVEGVARGFRGLRGLLDGSLGATSNPAAYGRALDGLTASAHGLVEAYMDVVEQDREWFFTFHMFLFSGATFFLIWVGVVVYGYEAGQARQLTDIRAARDTARAYEYRFRGVVREAADPLVVFDLEGRVVEASRSAAYLLGYTPEHLRSLAIGEIAPSLSLAEREALWGELISGAPAAVRGTWCRQDGTAVPVVVSLGFVAGEEAGGQSLVLAHARQEAGGGPETTTG